MSKKGIALLIGKLPPPDKLGKKSKTDDTDEAEDEDDAEDEGSADDGEVTAMKAFLSASDRGDAEAAVKAMKRFNKICAAEYDEEE